MKKTLHALTITTFLLLIAPLAFGQVAEKTLVKSFAVAKGQVITMDVSSPVEVKTWNNDLMRVQITIKLANGNESILKSLISAGRYNFVATDDAGNMVITAPNLDREVTVGGEVLQDALSIIVFVPDNVTVKTKQPSNTSPGSSF